MVSPSKRSRCSVPLSSSNHNSARPLAERVIAASAMPTSCALMGQRWPRNRRGTPAPGSRGPHNANALRKRLPEQPGHEPDRDQADETRHRQTAERGGRADSVDERSARVHEAESVRQTTRREHGIDQNGPRAAEREREKLARRQPLSAEQPGRGAPRHGQRGRTRRRQRRPAGGARSGAAVRATGRATARGPSPPMRRPGRETRCSPESARSSAG